MTIERRTKVLDFTVPFSGRVLDNGPVKRTQEEQWTMQNINGVFSNEELLKMFVNSDEGEMIVGDLTVEDPETVSFTRVNPGLPVRLEPPKRLTGEQINRAGFKTQRDSREREHVLVWKPTRSNRRQHA